MQTNNFVDFSAQSALRSIRAPAHSALPLNALPLNPRSAQSALRSIRAPLNLRSAQSALRSIRAPVHSALRSIRAPAQCAPAQCAPLNAFPLNPIQWTHIILFKVSFILSGNTADAEVARPSKITWREIDGGKKIRPLEAADEAKGDFKLTTSRLNTVLQIGILIFVTSFIFS